MIMQNDANPHTTRVEKTILVAMSIIVLLLVPEKSRVSHYFLQRAVNIYYRMACSKESLFV
jgi:hypothetical protein